MREVVIDAEFRSLIPPLSSDEKAQLESNIVAEGCRDALVTWNGVLLDGHNRLEICTHLNIPYKTIEIELPDRDAAADWIDKNQLGRRNLAPDQMSLLRGRRYNRAKKAPHGRSDRNFSGDQIDTPKTADRLAKEHGVSPATIKRDGKIAAFMDEHPEEAKEVLNRGKTLTEVRRETEVANIYGTITHNRARGTHLLEPMKAIIKRLKDAAVPINEICTQLGMRPEEVFRLSELSREDFLALMVTDKSFSKAIYITKT